MEQPMSDAWDLADAAAIRAGVVLRPLVSPEDADAIARVLRATWGTDEPMPREMVIALAEAGNVPYGAVADDALVGYVLGWAGVNAHDGLHVHSHQLATLSGTQNRGVGYALKLAQRAQALDSGITLIRWTFDPLVSRNAWFNLAKLGAVADRFLPNFYGAMTDEINAGERSDRLMVRWDLEKAAGQAPPVVGRDVLARSGDDPDAPVPTEVQAPAGAEPALISIPRGYHEIRSRDPWLAALWREATGTAFTLCFRAGYIVAGFTEDSTYVLTKAGA
jgi:predicted GNAT superfamily acetyltransferase